MFAVEAQIPRFYCRVGIEGNDDVRGVSLFAELHHLDCGPEDDQKGRCVGCFCFELIDCLDLFIFFSLEYVFDGPVMGVLDR